MLTPDEREEYRIQDLLERAESMDEPEETYPCFLCGEKIDGEKLVQINGEDVCQECIDYNKEEGESTYQMVLEEQRRHKERIKSLNEKLNKIDFNNLVEEIKSEFKILKP